MAFLITSLEQLTPQHLTELLSRSGVIDHGRVISITNKLTKKLVASVVSRLEIRYSADASPAAPTSLFLKISGPDLLEKVSFERGREVEFYDLIAPEMPEAPFIRCYHANYSPETGSSLLLLEDLSETHSQPTSPALPSERQSEAAVESLARMHAFWWEHPKLGKEIGNVFDQAGLDDFLIGVETSVIGFMDFLGDRLSGERRRIYERLLSSKHSIWGGLTNQKGLTVTHGDAHWWNFLYPLEPRKDRVRLFDWQLWHVDLGARDLAFLVAIGGFADRNAALEQHLTRYYYETLAECGVENYSWADFWRDYRFSAIRNLNLPVIFWSQGRSEKLWASNLERALAAFDQLGCSELLGD